MSSNASMVFEIPYGDLRVLGEEVMKEMGIFVES
jgi:hypothetical protein